MADAGRVIAGSAKGTRLAAPGPGTRALTDRVKQVLFGILEPGLPGAVVLDLFAGSGAAAIEALSRGAERAVLVERDAGAARVAAANLARCGFAARAVVVRRAAAAWLADPAAAAAGPFDLVLLDPPYGDPALLEEVLTLLGPVLAPGAMVVAKHFWRDPPPPAAGLLRSARDRRFGETTLTFYRHGTAEEPRR